ncbi:MAG TPA: hypothetical protein V6D11_29595 [Waterburya sp.]|jgi:hypothetical protein
MSQDLSQAPEPEQQQEEQQVDSITLLCNRLGEIEAALGIGGCEGVQSSLLNRLTAIESSLSKDQRERNLPATISRTEASDLSFLRRNGILLEDISSGKVRIV